VTCGTSASRKAALAAAPRAHTASYVAGAVAAETSPAAAATATHVCAAERPRRPSSSPGSSTPAPARIAASSGRSLVASRADASARPSSVAAAASASATASAASPASSASATFERHDRAAANRAGRSRDVVSVARRGPSPHAPNASVERTFEAFEAFEAFDVSLSRRDDGGAGIATFASGGGGALALALALAPRETVPFSSPGGDESTVSTAPVSGSIATTFPSASDATTTPLESHASAATSPGSAASSEASRTVAGARVEKAARDEEEPEPFVPSDDALEPSRSACTAWKETTRPRETANRVVSPGGSVVFLYVFFAKEAGPP
jgi:hypothetical protein